MVSMTQPVDGSGQGRRDHDETYGKDYYISSRHRAHWITDNDDNQYSFDVFVAMIKTKDFIIVAKYHFIDCLLPGDPHPILIGAIPKSVRLVLAMMMIKICRTSLTTEVNCFASTSVERNTLYSGEKYFVSCE